MIGAYGILFWGGPLLVLFFISLGYWGVFDVMGFFGFWALCGMIFFNIGLSYWEELVFLVVASLVTITRNGVSESFTVNDLWKEFPIYEFSFYAKSTLNFVGIVIAAIFYSDFCDHVDYISEFMVASETELLQADAIRCLDPEQQLAEGRCEEVERILKGQDPNASEAEQVEGEDADGEEAEKAEGDDDDDFERSAEEDDDDDDERPADKKDEDDF
jgi:hypothetical protein